MLYQYDQKITVPGMLLGNAETNFSSRLLSNKKKNSPYIPASTIGFVK